MCEQIQIILILSIPDLVRLRVDRASKFMRSMYERKNSIVRFPNDGCVLDTHSTYGIHNITCLLSNCHFKLDHSIQPQKWSMPPNEEISSYDWCNTITKTLRKSNQSFYLRNFIKFTFVKYSEHLLKQTRIEMKTLRRNIFHRLSFNAITMLHGHCKSHTTVRRSHLAR